MSLLSWAEGKVEQRVLDASLRAINENTAVLLVYGPDSVALASSILGSITLANRDLTTDDPTYGELWARLLDRYRQVPAQQLDKMAETVLRSMASVPGISVLDQQAGRLLAGYLKAISLAQTSRSRSSEFIALIGAYHGVFSKAAGIAVEHQARSQGAYSTDRDRTP